MKEIAAGVDGPGKGKPASESEVRTAVESLDEAALARLGVFADRRLRGCAPAVLKGRQSKDLVQEAIARTLDGSRTWKKSIPFHTHLVGVMRSLASHWEEQVQADPATPFSSLEHESEEGELIGPHLRIPVRDADLGRLAEVREELGLLIEHFEDDVISSLVIDGILAGYIRAELPEALGISVNECEAAWKKVRRHAMHLLGRGKRP